MGSWQINNVKTILRPVANGNKTSSDKHIFQLRYPSVRLKRPLGNIPMYLIDMDENTVIFTFLLN